MKIGTVELRFSLLSVLVFAVFSFGFFAAAFFGPPEMAAGVRSNLVWIIPVLFMFLAIPLLLNYVSQQEYADLAPYYESEAEPFRIRQVSERSLGRIVKISGVVRAVRFRFLNRPQFVVADRTGEIPVRMFTNPPDGIGSGDAVEVFGQVIRRYIVAGDPVINGVLIRKTGSKKE